ncbi:MAG: tyrosine-type recombinase/integrase [Colwellia sp.]|nr:tyrosine-type recombinase/integrase [Colwellia sp.]
MATIIPRVRADGTTAYRVQIIIKKKGEIVHRESATFDKKRDAELWGKKRDTTLSTPDAIDKIKEEKAADVTVKKLIEMYEEKVGKLQQWGRSKQAVLNSWKNNEEGLAKVTDVNSAWLIDYCIKRSEQGAKPPTINQDIVFLRSVFGVAKDVLGVPVGLHPFIDVQPTLKKLGLVSKAGKRSRRPEIDELTKIIEVARKRGKTIKRRGIPRIPIDKLIIFAMFSARRVSESCRIQWSDLDYDNKKILVRDLKDPKNKKDNHFLATVPDEAWAVIESMPKVKGEDRIFPYNSASVSAAFEKCRIKAGLSCDDPDDNLTLHDLRHEALSWLAEKNGLPDENWDIPRLQMVSGHKNWDVLQTYVNLLTGKPVDRWKNWEWKTKVLE